jgi:hypothetical protein
MFDPAVDPVLPMLDVFHFGIELYADGGRSHDFLRQFLERRCGFPG